MRFRLLVLLACLAMIVSAGLWAGLPRDGEPAAESAELAAAATRHTQEQFTTTADFGGGRLAGLTTRGGSLHLGTDTATTRLGGVSYDSGSWTSPVVQPGHTFHELIPSWRAMANSSAWVTVRARVRATNGTWSGWKQMAQWRSTLGRTTFGAQSDRIASVGVDTLKARSGVLLGAYQLRVDLLRKQGTASAPVVGSVHAVATRIGAVPPTSKPLYGARSLTVPAYSQMTHRGEYPQYGGGGQAWCSPTSLSMILAYYGARPTAREYAWVSTRYRDRWVDHVVRQVYDNGYDGAGNWAFNTAYAGTRLPEAMVTRLRNLRHVERFIARGIPVQVSISFGRGQLRGAPIGATNGHLVVVTGFTKTGAVRVNDPAASSNAGVRRTYDRAQFERAWLRKSHGLAYLVRDRAHTFPTGYTG